MEPTGFKAKGSFGIPEGLKKELDTARKAGPQQAPTHPKTPTPVEVQAVSAEEGRLSEEPFVVGVDKDVKTPEDASKSLRELRTKLEESLGCVLDEKDIQDYIFRGRLTKETTVIPGLLRGTFQTLTPTELMEIDEHMASFRDKGKHTSEGLLNEQAIVTLSYCWVAAAGKPLIGGNEPKKREEKIRKMGAITVDSASRAFNELNLLLRVLFGERQFLKKS